jgi:hypothetical protein
MCSCKYAYCVGGGGDIICINVSFYLVYNFLVDLSSQIYSFVEF